MGGGGGGGIHNHTHKTAIPGGPIHIHLAPPMFKFITSKVECTKDRGPGMDAQGSKWHPIP